MLADRWLSIAEEHLARFHAEALGEVEAAATLTAERVAAGGAIHHLDTGHTAREPIRRAGGLVALHAIEVDYALRHDAPPGREERGLAQDYYYDNEAGLMLIGGPPQVDTTQMPEYQGPAFAVYRMITGYAYTIPRSEYSERARVIVGSPCG